MIDPAHKLSISKQAKLLNIRRSANLLSTTPDLRRGPDSDAAH